MTVITAIVILMVYVTFALFVAAAFSKKHKKMLGSVFGWVFTATISLLAIWGFLRNIL